ncbi:MAG: response regulator [Actinobacteria bacterium]|nr:response regulator [Actinomycetota bacterium]
MANVLIVDDEEDIRNLSSQILRSKGYKIDTAADGDEALQKTKQNPYDLALVDLVLPGGINGLDIIKEIARSSSDTRIVAFSGFCDANIIEETTRAGAHGFLSKPFFSDQLVQTVRKWLGEKDNSKKIGDDNKKKRDEDSDSEPGIFSSFPKTAVRNILLMGTKKELQPGLKMNINYNKEISLLLSGKANVLFENQIVSKIQEGDMIGGSTIFTKNNLNDSVILEAETLCDLLTIPKNKLKSYFAEQQLSLLLRFSANIILDLSQKLFRSYMELAQMKASEKTAFH